MKRGSTAVSALLVAVLAASFTAAAGNGTPVNPASANPLTLSIIGDLPYNPTQLAAFPSWVDGISGHPEVALTTSETYGALVLHTLDR